MTRRTKTVLAVPVLILALLLGAWAYLLWPLDTSPHLYKYAKSSDGSWTVNLYRKHRSLSLGDPVDILVRVYDRQGNLAFEKSLYIVDSWKQAEQYCSEITFDGTKIMLGPGFMSGDGPGFFVIDTSNLKGRWFYETQSNNSFNASGNSAAFIRQLECLFGCVPPR
jgi:hypothetical protein